MKLLLITLLLTSLAYSDIDYPGFTTPKVSVSGDFFVVDYYHNRKRIKYRDTCFSTGEIKSELTVVGEIPWGTYQLPEMYKTFNEYTYRLGMTKGKRRLERIPVLRFFLDSSDNKDSIEINLPNYFPMKQRYGRNSCHIDDYYVLNSRLALIYFDEKQRTAFSGITDSSGVVHKRFKLGKTPFHTPFYHSQLVQYKQNIYMLFFNSKGTLYILRYNQSLHVTGFKRIKHFPGKNEFPSFAISEDTMFIAFRRKKGKGKDKGDMIHYHTIPNIEEFFNEK